MHVFLASHCSGLSSQWKLYLKVKQSIDIIFIIKINLQLLFKKNNIWQPSGSHKLHWMIIFHFVTFMVKSYYIYRDSDYYIYGSNIITFIVSTLLHLWWVLLILWLVLHLWLIITFLGEKTRPHFRCKLMCLSQYPTMNALSQPLSLQTSERFSWRSLGSDTVSPLPWF